MHLPTTRIVQLLCIVSLTACAPGCDKDGPGNCQFVDENHDVTLCGWTHGGNFKPMNRTFGGYIQLVRGSDTGILTSRTACSTGGQTHCFRFAYGFGVDDIFTLSVSIKYALNESLLWILSSGGGWNDASVPIKTNHDFNVVFKVDRHCGHNANEGSVRIDVTRYETKANYCSFQPATASPTSVPTIPGSCNSTIPLPSTTQKTTTSHDTLTETTKLILHEAVTGTTISHDAVTGTTISHDKVTETNATADFYTSSSNGGNQQTRTTINPTTTTTNKLVTDSTVTANSSIISSIAGSQRTSTTKTDKPSTPSDNSEIDPAESPNEVGISIVVVIGVIVFILIVIVLLILFRRKRRHSWEANNAQPNTDSHHLNESPPTQQSDSCNLIRNPEYPTTSAESAMPIYAVVNKQRKTIQENPPLSPNEICEQNSEQQWQNAESETARKLCQYGDGITSTPRQPDQLMAGTDSVYQVPRGGPTINSEDKGEEYNALDFEGNKRVADLDHAEGKHEGGAGDLYSHLNDGDDGTYSEVDRQKRPEVVGDEYSHIW